MVAAVLILIELDDLENSGSQMRSASEGQQWISARFQEVAGGYGVLGAVNGGLEPTGWYPFGKVFEILAIKKHMFLKILMR
jgi:hypothetical protein